MSTVRHILAWRRSPHYFLSIRQLTSQVPTNKTWAEKDGSFKRQESLFRNFLSSDPNAEFPAEAGRYHLYVSLACPWAHRTLLARHLKGLTQLISVSTVHWKMGSKGWRFPSNEEIEEMKSHAVAANEYGSEDSLYGLTRISDLYYRANPEYNARFTVPVLWDKKKETIVSNELSEILRMLNTAFNELLPAKYAEVDFYPADLQAKIDNVNSWIYDNINNGVYKTGFATSSEVYTKECLNVFAHLDKLEELFKENHAKKEEFLAGNILTEADIRLFTTIIRFDPVYVQHFKCNIGMIRYDYPHIHQWLKLLYWKIPGFQETTDFNHIKKHYTQSHPAINPHGITPLGPVPNIQP